MANSTCSIDGCERAVLKRGWCKAHYLRWYRHGDPLKGRGTVAPTIVEATCSVDGCERIVDSRGLCNPHYQRLLRTGDPGGAEIELKRKGATCSVDGCDQRHYAFDLCSKHWQRFRKYGDVDAVFVSHFKGDDAGYSAVHERLNRSRGHAREHACAHCGDAAVDWAYDGLCPNEKVGERHGMMLAYSTDPDRYMPLCRGCHAEYDGNTPTRN